MDNKRQTFYSFLNAHMVTKTDTSEVTNTRINPGGKFHINDNEYFSKFLPLYYRDVVSKNRDESLTEKQRVTDGPIAVDFDFRYTLETTSKQYSEKDVKTMIMEYLQELKNIFQFTDTPFPIYIFEKPHVNRLEEKNVTKDGIHMIIGIQSDRETQMLLREAMMERLKKIWGHLPLLNTLEDVLDKGISQGTTNWQLYGSKKPNHDTYRLTHVFEFEFDESNGDFIESVTNIRKFDYNKDFAKLSVRYNDHPYFFLADNFIPIHDAYKEKTMEKKKVVAARASYNSDNQLSSHTHFQSIEEIKEVFETFKESLNMNEHDILEAAELVMILPKQYYSNYDKWIRVGWALRNISDKLWIAWVLFSSQWENFRLDSIGTELMTIWKDRKRENGLTKGSIIYWAQTDNPVEFKKAQENHIDYYLRLSIKNITPDGVIKNEKNIGCGDADIAKILFMMKNHQYNCAAVKSDQWYKFQNHRWVENDSGTSLRKSISEELRDLYRRKIDDYGMSLSSNGSSEDNLKKSEGMTNKILEIIMKLSQTTHKDHIMKEARELFYDPDQKFLNNLDSDPYLLCFNNGVLDMRERQFRKGRPDDYLQKCTNIDYKKLDRERDGETIKEIEDFMEKLFPLEELRDYMWKHLASLLLGINKDQKLHIYIGGGANGKSVFTDLLKKCFGDYHDGSVPISMITQARQKQGTASPDIVMLKGLRVAIMQEPSKNDQINDGAMKELVSGVEPIRGRPMWGVPIQFVPQFKLCVCSNNLPKVSNTDHGTWRRIAVVPFMSTFTDNPEVGDPDRPYQFQKDPSINDKFDKWCEVLMSMLVDILFSAPDDKSMGRLIPCKIVDAASKKYRDREDHISEFISEKIVKDPNGRITKTGINNEFANWYQGTYGRGGPTNKEVHERLDAELGKYSSKISGWGGYRILTTEDIENVYNSDDDEDIDDISDGDI